MSGIDPGPWRAGLAVIGGPVVSAVLVVQCGVEWLRPAGRELRDEIDAALMRVLLARDDLVADRVVRHGVPVAGDLAPGEQAALSEAHAEWMYRLAATGVLLGAGRRARVHRLAAAGGGRSVGMADGMAWSVGGAWSDPDTASVVRGILRTRAAVIPLTSHGVDLDGPFGDSDPSVYL